jgi:hypothetical protein
MPASSADTSQNPLGEGLASKTCDFHFYCCFGLRANSKSQDRTAKRLLVRLAAQDHKLVDGKRHDETFDLLAQVALLGFVLGPRLLGATVP